MKLEWRNPWFGGDDWKPVEATTLEGAARELRGPHHEETVIRDADTKQVFVRKSRS